MLQAIRNKGGIIKPTHLMYKANLAHRQLKDYLNDLENNQLVIIKKEKGKEKIMISDKGQEYLQKIKEMKKFENMFRF